MIDDTKLDAPTLRWAAAHIRKFIGGTPANGADAFSFAAESMDNWATEVEMAAAAHATDTAERKANMARLEHKALDTYQPGTQVFICENTDTGDLQWSILPCAEPDFWIWSYPTKDEALFVCKGRRWHVMSIQTMPHRMQDGPFDDD